MKKSKFILILLILVFYIFMAFSLTKQLFGVELSGDFTTKYIWNDPNKESIVYSPDTEYDTNGYLFLNPRFGTNYKDLVKIYLDSEIDIADSTMAKDSDTRNDARSFKINELYSQVNFFDKLFLKTGKQVVKWGVGYFYNPSNFLNPQRKQLESESNTVEGVNLIDLTLLTQHLTISVISVPSNDIEQNRYGAIISTSELIPFTDLYFTGYYSKKDMGKGGVAFSSNPFAKILYIDGLLIYSEAGFYKRSQRYNLEKQTIVHPVTNVVYETNNMIDNPDEWYWSYDGGLSFELPKLRTMIIGEYYYIKDALHANDYKRLSGNISDTSALLYSTDITGIENTVAGMNMMWIPELMKFGQSAKQYFAISIQQPSITSSSNAFTDTLGFGISAIINLDDRSFLLIGSLSSSIVENSSITFDAMWANGEENTEYNNLPDKLRLGMSVSVGF